MSGLPIFVDPSATVVYHTTVPSAGGQGLASGSHSHQHLPPTVTMSVVQNNSQRKNDPLANVPLPPGMEIVLGGKKYKIQYQSYEMTREKATEYIAKCTGTPYSRMSAPPDPETFYLAWGTTGVSREGIGGLGGSTATPAATDPIGAKPPAVATTIAGERGTTRRSSISTAVPEDKHQSQKTPDEVYTAMSPAASGLPAPFSRGGTLPQQQQQLPTVPEQQVATADSNRHYQVPTYAPPPKDSDQQQENLGYFWEDGVWKVWHADSSKTPASAVGESGARSTMPPPLPTQQEQYSQQSQAPYPSQQLQTERQQYQYQYQYPEARQQPQQQVQQSPSLVAASATHDHSSYAEPYVPPPHHSQMPPSVRGPPQPPTGLLQAHGIADSSNTQGTSSGDPMLQRYMI